MGYTIYCLGDTGGVVRQNTGYSTAAIKSNQYLTYIHVTGIKIPSVHDSSVKCCGISYRGPDIIVNGHYESYKSIQYSLTCNR